MSDSLVLKPFYLPEQLTKAGRDGNSLMTEFYYTLTFMRDSAISGNVPMKLGRGYFDLNTNETEREKPGLQLANFAIVTETLDLDFEVLNNRFSLNTIINYIQAQMDASVNSLTGEFFQVNDHFVLKFRYNKKSFSADLNDLDQESIREVFMEAAKWYLREEKPTIYASYCLKKNDLTDVEEVLKRAVKTTGSEASISECYYMLGVFFLKQGDLSNASDYFHLTIESSSKYQAEVLNGLGLIEQRKLHFKTAQQYFIKALDEDSKNIPVLVNLASSYFSNSQLSLADSIYSLVLKSDSLRVEAIYGHGLCLYKLQDLKKSSSMMGRVVQIEPNHYQSWINRAETFSLVKSPLNETKVIYDMVNENIGDVQSVLNAANYFRRSARTKEVVNVLERYRYAFFSNSEFLYQLAFAYFNNGQFAKAKETSDLLRERISNELSVNHNQQSLIYLSAEIDFLSANYLLAIEKYQRVQLLKDGANLNLSLRLLQCYYRVGQFTDYYTTIRMAYSQIQNSSDIKRLCEHICYLGDTLSAIDLFDLHIRHEKNSPIAYDQYGSFLESIGKMDQAKEKRNVARALDTTNYVYQSNYAALLVKQNKIEEAEKEFRLVLLRDRFDIDVWFDVVEVLFRKKTAADSSEAFLFLDSISNNQKYNAWVLYRAGKGFLGCQDYQKANVLFQEAVSGDSTLAIAWFDLGKSFYHLKKYEEAYTACRQSWSIDPGDESILTWIDLTLMKMEDNSRAIQSLRMHIKINPVNAYALNNLAYYLGVEGRYDEALVIAYKALSLRSLDQYIKGKLYSTIAEQYAYKKDESNFFKFLQMAVALRWKPSSAELKNEPYIRFKDDKNFRAIVNRAGK